ncbi:MAG: HAD family hydrolase, partial [Gemmiger sp.]
IPALVQALKAAGVQMAVLSNKADPLAREVVADYFDAALFDAIHGARPGIAIKPDPAGTRALLAELGADAATTLYVGDSDVDVLTAHNAGLRCCGVLWGFRSREELAGAGADYLAADPETLGQIIMR